MRLLILLLALALGCAEGSGSADPSQPDLGTDSGNSLEDLGHVEDAGDTEDMGNNLTPDMSADMTEDSSPDMPEPQPFTQTTFMPSGGGGEANTAQHQLRIVVGAPSPLGELRTNQHHIQLGVGSAQHGQ